MSGRKKIGLGIAAAVALLFLVVLLVKSGGNERPALTRVKVKRGTIVEKALAVGTIEPVSQVSVKSKISGVVKRLFVEEGDYVRKGDPLLEVQPEPTPLELAEAKRNVELAQIEADNLKRELDRQKQLLQKNLVSPQAYENLDRQYREAELRRKIAAEKLALLEKGRVQIAGTAIETVVRAPISGYVLERAIEVGDPVVPLTSFQEGTVLMNLADMSDLIFKGTVDEIDVGKLREGMAADIQVGALQDAKLTGRVRRISLKAQKRDNAIVFPVEIALGQANGVVLRAGYSANATIIIDRRDSTLMIPERVVDFREGKAYVRIPGPNGEPVEREIEVGLSDAINIEVLSGLEEGDEVFEKPTKEIT